ncbi:serine/threonine-protein kinase [Saccharothrix xinjiangensis]|uniref:non-specific serine/threonine protein kinase n=1 Tax=Saccharothrix xinjiangensis TaxID=204798 RepID=A0ABV9Y5V5_9PSEU
MQLPGLSDLTPLGQGGFATVYRARQVQLNREVAVKIDNRVLRTERDRRRFLREAHAAARLSGHPHVVSVHDAAFTPDGTPYLVMELCTSGSLADLVKREGPQQPERVRQFGIQLADALAVAHAEGVLHRDIKPGNILLDRYGTAKLADFGLAALLDAEGSSTVTRDSLSPSYAPPEAFAMAHPTPAADVYSLAATLYDLLAGKPPRPVPWPVESFDHLGEVLRSPVPPVPGVPRDLHEALVRALEPDTANRTPSAALLQRELDGRSGAVTPPQVGPQAPWGAPSGPPQIPSGPPQTPQYVAPAFATSPPTPKKSLPVVLGAAALAAVVAVGAWWWTNRDTDAQAGDGAPSSTTDVTRAAAGEPPPFLDACGTGFCVAEPTCYHGINNFGGQPAVARRAADCSVEHFWEAFAGGWLSGPVPRVSSDDLAKAPEVVGVCTAGAMKANTRPTVDTSTWQITAVGFTEGNRSYFHCLASEPGAGQVTTSAFGS